MQCWCKNETHSLKIEADFVADPIWCSKCNCNIDMEELPLSEQLKADLYVWTQTFGKWMDKETDNLVKGAYELINEYNNHGLELTERVKEELGNKYIILYVPSA